MKLSKLIQALDPPIHSVKNTEIKGIACDSRLVEKGFLFVAVKGTEDNGHKFINMAIKNGAEVVVLQEGHAKINPVLKNQVQLICVPDSRHALINLSARFYDYPSKDLKVIGVTGTNGKTTITYLLEEIFTIVGFSCGVIGTINYRIGNKVFPAKNTTPGPLEMQGLLAKMRKEKINYAIMETSSHALDQGRVGLIDFKAAIFTNLTGDHLDYHKSIRNYFLAKARLFQGLKDNSYAIINSDDAYGKALIKLTKAKVITYGLENARVWASDITLGSDGSQFLVVFPGGRISIKTKLIGKHNVYNILAAAALGLSQGISPVMIKKGIESLCLVPGRLEQIDCGQPFRVLVDYAHTEDALKNVLYSLRDISHRRIIIVFGCGGNRDRTKRPKMGRVASQLADYAIITSDNPRSEKPQDITRQIIEGIKKDNFEIILNRKNAIKKAFALAKVDDIVLIAGKGHERYQIFKDRTVEFDDRRISHQILKRMGYN